MHSVVAKYLLLYVQANAIVCSGKMRDAGALLRENYPVWCNGITPIGCFNKKPKRAFDPLIIQEQRAKYDEAIAVCDDCGVVTIPKELHTKEFLDKLIAIEEQEDIWFDRLDRKKPELLSLKKE